MTGLLQEDNLELSLPLECSISGGVSGYDHVLRVQETTFVVACSNIACLRFGNVKFSDKSLTLSDQEQGQITINSLMINIGREYLFYLLYLV